VRCQDKQITSAKISQSKGTERSNIWQAGNEAKEGERQNRKEKEGGPLTGTLMGSRAERLASREHCFCLKHSKKWNNNPRKLCQIKFRLFKESQEYFLFLSFPSPQKWKHLFCSSCGQKEIYFLWHKQPKNPLTGAEFLLEAWNYRSRPLTGQGSRGTLACASYAGLFGFMVRVLSFKRRSTWKRWRLCSGKVRTCLDRGVLYNNGLGRLVWTSKPKIFTYFVIIHVVSAESPCRKSLFRPSSNYFKSRHSSRKKHSVCLYILCCCVPKTKNSNLVPKFKNRDKLYAAK